MRQQSERQALFALGATLAVLGAEDVRCFDLATGRVDSSRPLPEDWSDVVGNAVVVGNRLIGRIGRASVVALEPCTGRVQWMTSLATDTLAFAARGDAVLVATTVPC